MKGYIILGILLVIFVALAGCLAQGQDFIIIESTSSDGNVSSVTGTAPISSTEGTTPDISFDPCPEGQFYIISGGDWTCVNDQNAVGSGQPMLSQDQWDENFVIAYDNNIALTKTEVWTSADNNYALLITISDTNDEGRIDRVAIANYLDTNATTECDSNQALTGGGDCVDLTGFNIQGSGQPMISQDLWDANFIVAYDNNIAQTKSEIWGAADANYLLFILLTDTNSEGRINRVAISNYLDTNATTECDSNQALTGAGDCVDLTGFHTGGTDGFQPMMTQAQVDLNWVASWNAYYDGNWNASFDSNTFDDLDFNANVKALDTNATTECDSNQALTGAGNCVDITGFHIDTDTFQPMMTQGQVDENWITNWNDAYDGNWNSSFDSNTFDDADFNANIKNLDTNAGTACTAEQFLEGDGDCVGIDLNHFKIENNIFDLSDNVHKIENAFNGQFLETVDIDVNSDGTDVNLYIWRKTQDGNLTLHFSDEFSTFDSDPPAEIELTAGSDTNPTLNYVFIPVSTKVLTVNTTGFPTTEHAPVATVVVQSASGVQTDGAYKVHLWENHSVGDENVGHISHITNWIRSQHATWKSGVAQTLTITAQAGATDDVNFAVTSGIVLQLHDHAFPKFNTEDGNALFVINDSSTAYTKITDLSALLTDSDGDSMSGKYFSLVIWGVMSEKSIDSHLFVNLPSGSYNRQGDATDDVSGYTNFTIPSAYKGTGFLISKLVLRHQPAANGTWTSIQEIDLRGQIPSVIAGGGTTAITTEFSDNTFKLFDESDVTKEMQFQVGEVSASTTRTITIPDWDFNMGRPEVFDINMLTENVFSGADIFTLSDMNRNVVTDCSGDANSVLTSQGLCQNIDSFSTSADGFQPMMSQDQVDENFLDMFDTNTYGSTDFNASYWDRITLTSLKDLIWGSDFNAAYWTQTALNSLSNLVFDTDFNAAYWSRITLADLSDLIFDSDFNAAYAAQNASVSFANVDVTGSDTNFTIIETDDIIISDGFIKYNGMDYNIPELNTSVLSRCAGDSNMVLTSEDICQSIDDFDVQGTGNGGATILDELTDVSNINYVDGNVLRADGSGYVTAKLDHNDLAETGTNSHNQVDDHIDDSSNPHTVTVAQIGAVATTGNESIGGEKTFTTIPILPASSPTNDDHATRKKYVDDTAAGLTWRKPVIDKNLSAPPGGPAVGNRYIVMAVGTGAWAGHDWNILDYNGSDWISDGENVDGWAVFTTFDSKGWTWSSSDGNWIQFSGGTVYNALDGLDLTGTDFNIDIKASDGLKVDSTELTVAYDNTSIGITDSNLAVQTGGITNDMLAGSITEDKFDFIDTADKVDWNALTLTNSELDDIFNVNAPSPSDDQVLSWDAGSSKWIPSTASAAGGVAKTTIIDIDVLSDPKTSQRWTNMPAAMTELYGNSQGRVKVDLAQATQYRLVVYQPIAGFAGAWLDLNYSTDGGSTWLMASATAGDGNVLIESTGVNVGDWVNLAGGAQSDVWIRIIGAEGDGKKDPTFTRIATQFKVPGGDDANRTDLNLTGVASDKVLNSWIPNLDVVFDLGSAVLRWATGWFQDLVVSKDANVMGQTNTYDLNIGNKITEDVNLDEGVDINFNAGVLYLPDANICGGTPPNDGSDRSILHFNESVTGANGESGTLTTRIQGHWDMEEGTGTSIGDSSGNSHTLTKNGGDWNANGKYGSAITYNAASDFLYRADDIAFDIETGDFSTGCWVYPDVTGSTHAMISKYSGGGWMLYVSSISVVFAITDGVDAFFPSGGTVSTGQWNFVAGTWDASTETVNIYVNGSATSTTNAPEDMDSISTAHQLRVALSAGGNHPFNGTIDECFVLKNVVLDNNELDMIYNNRWKDKTYMYESQMDSGYYAFEGSSLSYPTAGNIQKDVGTISMWVYPTFTATNGVHEIWFDMQTATNRNRIDLTKTSGSDIRFIIYDDAGDSIWEEYDVTLDNFPNNVWHHLVATWDNGVLEFYLNGIEVGTSTGTGTGKLTELPSTMYIGRWSDSQAREPNSIIDEFVIRNRALTPEEVYCEYLSGQNGHQTVLGEV